MRTPLVVAALALVVTAVTSAPAKARDTTNPYPGYSSATYADPAHWLCRPDKDDVCDTDMDATSIKANGKAKVERFRAAKKPKIDCFYVYRRSRPTRPATATSFPATTRSSSSSASRPHGSARCAACSRPSTGR
jgi:hypothetical protein